MAIVDEIIGRAKQEAAEKAGNIDRHWKQYRTVVAASVARQLTESLVEFERVSKEHFSSRREAIASTMHTAFNGNNKWEHLRNRVIEILRENGIGDDTRRVHTHGGFRGALEEISAELLGHGVGVAATLDGQHTQVGFGPQTIHPTPSLRPADVEEIEHAEEGLPGIDLIPFLNSASSAQAPTVPQATSASGLFSATAIFSEFDNSPGSREQGGLFAHEVGGNFNADSSKVYGETTYGPVDFQLKTKIEANAFVGVQTKEDGSQKAGVSLGAGFAVVEGTINISIPVGEHCDATVGVTGRLGAAGAEAKLLQSTGAAGTTYEALIGAGLGLMGGRVGASLTCKNPDAGGEGTPAEAFTKNSSVQP